jgi:hypothetical protein
MQQQQPINTVLNLTLDEVNAILNGLGRSYTYNEIVGLIDKIKEQVVPQLPLPQFQENKPQEPVAETPEVNNG